MKNTGLEARPSVTSQWRWLTEGKGTDLAYLLTTLILLSFHGSGWYIAGPITSLTVAGLVWPNLRKMAAYWLAAVVILSVAAIHDWYLIDNHQYLLIYWCVALCLTGLAREVEREAILARSSALLLGLVMALSAGQKLSVPGYVNGSFFEFMLLREPRFASVSWLLGGVPLTDLELNRVLERQVLDPAIDVVPLESVTLHATHRLRMLAVVMTWATVLIEGSLSFLFLMPRPGRGAHHLRAAAILGFVLATYAVAPVIGFGWILITLALAQLPSEFQKFRIAFVGVFILLPLFEAPLAKLLPALTRVFGILRV